MVEQDNGGTYKEFQFGAQGNKLASMSGQSVSYGYLPLPGGSEAIYNSSGLWFYRLGDWLGSSRLTSNPTGSSRFRFSGAYAPYGEPYAETGATDDMFAGMNMDTVPSGSYPLYDALNREYHPVWGRWLSPDPAGMAAVDPTNPQWWNRYAYVTNNPLALVDPSGQFGYCPWGDAYNGCIPPPGPGGGGGGGGGGGPCVSSSVVVVHGYVVGVHPENNCGGTGGGGGGAAGGTNPANNGRKCTVGPANALQYAEATAEVAAMTDEFFLGLGPGNLTFDPNSATSQVMAQSGPVQDVLNSYYMTGQTSGLYTFGLPGLVSAGGNPVAQFVGSFRWGIASTDGGINLSLSNTTSFRSLTYDVGPQWQRGSWPTPMGNTHQTYNITANCQ